MPASLRRLALVFAALAALVAGLVSALVPAESAQAATANTAVLRAPGTLTGGHRMVSANGNFELLMGRNGDLLLYNRWGQVMWSTRTAGHHGAHLSLQANGNLVLRERSGQAVWATKTRGSHAVLELRASGVLELVAHRHALWYTHTAVKSGSRDNPVPGSLLASGSSLAAGHKLTSANGRASATMGAYGQFTDSGPDGIVWTTNSSGWAGARFTLATNGNLLLYAADGSALWQSRTRARGAVLMLANNGNLILYNVHGNAVWQSRHAAEPQIFPPGTSAPPVSVSHYPRNLTGDATSDTATMHATGCADATANTAGDRYAVVLDIGSQRTDLPGDAWGAMLTQTSTKLTDAQLVTAVEAYLDGYAGCMADYSRLLLAVATNNDNHQYFVEGSDTCPTPPAGTDDPLGTAGGTDWAENVIDPVATYAAQWPHITVAGGNDIEPGFAGCTSQATDWVTAFAAATTAPYVFIGSADGCPTVLGSTKDCNYGWTQQQIYQLAYGISPARSVPLPQIYIPAQAAQWANISRSGVRGGDAPIAFGGVLTAQGTCQPDGDCSLSGTTAWAKLWNALNTSPATTISGMPYATDLQVN